MRHPLRIALAALLALALAACASTPAPAPIQAKGATQITARATLTVWGPWETELNATAARGEALATSARQDLQAGRLSRDHARSISTTLTRAEAALQQARRGNAADPTPENRAALAEAQRLLAIAAALMEMPK